MIRSSKSLLVAMCAAGALLTAGAANASLNVFQTFTGNVGLSTSGCGSTSQSCNLTANVPAGSTILGAYLYSSMNDANSSPGGTLAGNPVSYSPLGANGFLQASRANVTSIVSSVVGSGGGAFTLNTTETNFAQDGEALVVIYSNAALPTSTIGILDGFSASSGDNSSISFANPLHPAAPGFQAEMRIGDGFGFNPGGVQDDAGNCVSGTCQFSTIDVNGLRMTNAAGNFDDGEGADGGLITVGDDNDPFTLAAPGAPQDLMDADHERYDLRPFITDGSTTIHIHTLNPSSDDNIFLETFQVTGEAVIHGNGVPEPATWAMMLMGFFGMGSMLRRRREAIA